MAEYDDGGWLHVGEGDANEFVAKCEAVEFDFDDPSATFIDYPGDGHFAFALGTRKRTVKVKNIWFATTAAKDEFLNRLETMQDIGTFILRLQITTAGAFAKWDGVNTKVPVLFKSVRGIYKPFGGNAEVWIIKQLTFVQGGALAL